MTTRTTVRNVTFTGRFKLPNMERAYPPGIYTVEIDEEVLDHISRLAYRRIATRLRLHSPGLTELLTIDPTDLDRALIEDAPPHETM